MHILTQLTFDTADEYQKFCAVMASADLTPKHLTKAEPARPVVSKAETPTTSAPAAKPATKTAAKPVAPPPPAEEEEIVEEGELTYAKVKEAVLNVSTTKGKAAARRALAVVGATTIGPHLAEADYPALMEACGKELA